MAHHLKRLFGRYRTPLLILGLLLVSASAFLILQGWQQSEPEGQQIPLEGSTAGGPGGLSDIGDSQQQVSIRLSEGQAQPQTVEPVPLATVEPLPEGEIENILVRLPALTGEPEDQVDFKLAQEPIPPPRTGETIEEAFPPPPERSQPEATAAGPLEVLRFAPEGEIPIAPFVNLTFNQPMVPLATLADLTAEEVPVRIEPQLPGTWRWLGTKTLTFEYDSELIDRLPKATEYRVSVPAGTQSAIGGVLAEPVEWSFTTPPPKMTTGYPYDVPQPLEPLFFIAFDQRIDPQAVLDKIQVNAGSQPVIVRLASEDEVQEDKQVSNLVKRTLEGRWLAFRAQEPLPADTQISVIIAAGMPSAEGPLVTKEAQTYTFHTYAPLRIEEHGCAWSNDTCRPLTPFYIRFNNSINTESYNESLLRIQPELPGAVVNLYGDTIQIRGASQGGTTYTVLVDGDIQDIFGQKLGDDAHLTFRVGPAEPVLFGPEQVLVTLDPAASKPVFSVYAINYPRLNVKIYAVQPSDWPEFKRYLREYQSTNARVKLPGRLVLDKTMPVESAADTLTEVGIDLSQVMDGKFGQFILVVEPPRSLFQRDQDRYWRTVHAWVQVTQIGLDAYSDHSQMVAWATALKDGAPLAGVSIQAGQDGPQAITGEDGVARFALSDSGFSYLVAQKGADQALLPNSIWSWDDPTWARRTVNDMLRWYTFDDRQMYRPGEEVHVKGWLRRVGGKQDGDVGLVGGAVTGVRYQITGPQGNDLGSGQAEVNSLGGYDFVFTLPQKVNLGSAQLYLQAEGDLSGLENSQYYHSFQIQEFRRPEFEVTARNESPGPYFAGDHAVVAVEAKYYAGDPLPNAEVTWQVISSPSNYEPPNWPDFTFGTWEPWWFYEGIYAEEYYGPGGPGSKVETFIGKTDASGNHYLRLDFEEAAKPRPLSVLAEATVMDVNRQAWTGTTSLLVHPANLYVGMRSERYFVERGTPLRIDLIVTDLDGNPIPDRPIEVQATRLEWKYQGVRWGETEADVQTCTLGSTSEPVTCTFETPVGGSYRITAQVSDELGRKNQSQFTRWVSGGQQPPARKVEQETVTLIPDKESYQAGDVAQILVQSPFSPAEGLLTVSRSGVLYTRRFQIEEGTATLEVPIEEAHVPNLNIQVDVVGAAPRSDDQGEVLPDAPSRPAYATGQLNLSVPPLQRTLSLQVTPAESELEPGGETNIAVRIKDANNQPVAGAELAVVVVDEAILALTNYQLADPVSVFYANRPADLWSVYGRASIVLTDPQALVEAAENVQVVEEKAVMEAPAAMPTMAAADQAQAGGRGGAAEPIRVRIDFNPLATFAPAVRSDANGEAQVAVKLPDNLTRYRVMVVAVDAGRQFGMAEANLVARLPLMVRPSAPRFLNFGDRFELPVVLQNQTDEPMTIDVVVRASNIELTGSAGLRVSVPARDRVEVRFPAATQSAGTARLQIAAVAGSYTDAATVELPVYTPATTEAFATYGVIDEGAVFQPVAAPSDVFPQFGGLEINTSSTALQALTDAVLYLVSYPYECSEQLASRVLAVAALRDVLTAFEAEGLPTSSEMESAVQRDIERLQGLQNADGGFPYWRQGQDSIPFNTIHVAHALQRAKIKGFAVPAEMQQRLLEHLRQIESHYPAGYSQRTRQTLSAYALYVRDLMGDRDPDKALRLIDQAGLENLDLDAVGWLWQVLGDDPAASEELEAIRRHVTNRAVETAGAANFTTSYDEQTYLLLSSDRRTDAILLEALIADSPQHDLIPKLVNGLLAHRTKGHWRNTQENVFVLLALDRYFNTFEAQTPDFVARIWLGETYAGSHEYRGRTTERRETVIPMTYLVEATPGGGAKDLVLSKEGAGRLYYRLGLRYAPTDLELDPIDMGFVVQRSYEAVDDPEDVTQDEEGAWHIKAGAHVRVRLTMVADNRRYHVALADPLPGGLEIVNPALAVSGSPPRDPNSPDYRYGWWWWGTWFEHQNLRDERAEAFTSLLWDGVYQYSYIARATTPGRFVVPPAKAEEMYSPEVFGRSGSDIVFVE
jgi:uncharacterized protein YfaS (alpha-2-macroglobulin family)